jgi:hypothetical protein
MVATVDNRYDLATMDLIARTTQLSQCEPQSSVHFVARDHQGRSYNGMTCTGRVFHKLSVQSEREVYLENRGSWYKEIEYDWGFEDAGVKWNYQGETEPSTATVTWQIGDQTKTLTFDLVLAPTEVKITFGKDEIGYGASTTVRIDVPNRDGKLSPVPAGWNKRFWVEIGSNQGYLYSLDSLQTGDWIEGKSSEVKFYAKPQPNATGTLRVPISVAVWNDYGGWGAASMRKPGQLDSLKNVILSMTSVTPERKTVLQSVVQSQMRALVTVAGAIEPFNWALGFDTLVVKKGGQLDHFLVRLSRDTIAHDDACVIILNAVDADNN